MMLDKAAIGRRIGHTLKDDLKEFLDSKGIPCSYKESKADIARKAYDAIQTDDDIRHIPTGNCLTSYDVKELFHINGKELRMMVQSGVVTVDKTYAHGSPCNVRARLSRADKVEALLQSDEYGREALQ